MAAANDVAPSRHPFRSWVPPQERSRSLALVYSGMFIGSCLGLGLSPSMIKAAGWPSVFHTFGVLGLVWAAVWKIRAASSPAKVRPGIAWRAGCCAEMRQLIIAIRKRVGRKRVHRVLCEAVAPVISVAPVLVDK